MACLPVWFEGVNLIGSVWHRLSGLCQSTALDVIYTPPRRFTHSKQWANLLKAFTFQILHAILTVCRLYKLVCRSIVRSGFECSFWNDFTENRLISSLAKQCADINMIANVFCFSLLPGTVQVLCFFVLGLSWSLDFWYQGVRVFPYCVWKYEISSYFLSFIFSSWIGWLMFTYIVFIIFLSCRTCTPSTATSTIWTSSLTWGNIS